MSKKSSQYSILDTNDDVNEERIEYLVKAAEIIQQENENNKPKQHNTSNDSMSFWNTTEHSIPQYEKYASKGRVIDIQFDDEFEHELKETSLKELEQDDIKPTKIKLLFSDGLDTEWQESYSYNSERDKIQKILSTYGDGRIDNIVGKNINIKPNREDESKKYKIIIPENTATSKLRMKLTEYRSKFAQRKSDSEQSYTKFIISNFLQLGCSLFIIFASSISIYSIPLFYSQYRINEIHIDEFLQSLFSVGLLLLITISLTFGLSFVIGMVLTDVEEPIGVVEKYIIYNFKKLGVKIYNKYMNLNSWLGNNI